MEEGDFISLTEPAHRPLRTAKAPIAVAAVVLLMALAAFGVLPIAGLALIAAVAVVAGRCIDPADAYAAIEWKIIFIILGMLVLGRAMEATGAAALMAHGVTEVFGRFGPVAVLSAIYLLASVRTEMISNNAVAVLLTPIALSIAEELGVDGRPFIVALMFGASANFATPIGYQTNTYVYGAGGYRFADFPRVGAPLNVILWLLASVLIPLFWPLRPVP